MAQYLLLTVNIVLLAYYIISKPVLLLQSHLWLIPSRLAIVIIAASNIYASCFAWFNLSSFAYLQSFNPNIYGIALGTYSLAILIFIRRYFDKFNLGIDSWKSVAMWSSNRQSSILLCLLPVAFTILLVASYFTQFQSFLSYEQLRQSSNLRIIIDLLQSIPIPFSLFAWAISYNREGRRAVYGKKNVRILKPVKSSFISIFLLVVLINQIFLALLIQANLDRDSFLAFILLYASFVFFAVRSSFEAKTIHLRLNLSSFTRSLLVVISFICVIFFAVSLPRWLGYGKGVSTTVDLFELTARAIQTQLFGLTLGGYNIPFNYDSGRSVVEGLRLPFDALLFNHQYSSLIKEFGTHVLGFRSDLGGAGMLSIHAFAFNYGLVASLIIFPLSTLLFLFAESMIFTHPLKWLSIRPSNLGLMVIFLVSLPSYKYLIYGFIRGADSLILFPPFIYSPMSLILFWVFLSSRLFMRNCR